LNKFVTVVVSLVVFGVFFFFLDNVLQHLQGLELFPTE